MAEANVRSIVVEYLQRHGFDGLYYSGECGCVLADLAPCGEMGEQCEPGVKLPCTCGEDCEFDVGPREEAPGE